MAAPEVTRAPARGSRQCGTLQFNHADDGRARRDLSLRPALAGLALAAILSAGNASRGAARRRSVVLITLDTTRADALGCYGGRAATPALDGLAARGLRYTGAITAVAADAARPRVAPDGLDPPEHGVLDNGIARLADGPADARDRAGCRRLRDRRVRGVARARPPLRPRARLRRVRRPHGRGTHRRVRLPRARRGRGHGRRARLAEDRPARASVLRLGPLLRRARAVRGDRARRTRSATRARSRRSTARSRALLAALPTDADAPVVAAVADHGESLGEHGERGHGLFLYGTVVHVPLVIAGPGLPSGRVVDGAVATRRLAATLLAASGAPGRLPGDVLPGAAGRPRRPRRPTARPGCPRPRTAGARSARGPTGAGASSTRRAASSSTRRGPGRTQNRAQSDGAVQSQLLAATDARVQAMTVRTPGALPIPASPRRSARSATCRVPADGAPARSIPRTASAARRARGRRRRLLDAGRATEALPQLRALCEKQPGQRAVPRPAGACAEDAGDRDGAVRTLRDARDLNPRPSSRTCNLADALRRKGDVGPARQELRRRDRAQPAPRRRLAGARRDGEGPGRPAEERALLARGAEAGTESTAMLTRLAQLEMSAGALALAEGQLREATALHARLLHGLAALGRGRRAAGPARRTRCSATSARSAGAARSRRAAAPRTPAPHAGRRRPRARGELESWCVSHPARAPAREAGRLLAAP